MAHLVVFDGLSLTGVSAWKYALEWALVALLVGIFEESLLRGYLQSTLARGLGFWWAALLLSAAFALWHLSNGGESPLGLLVVGMGGLVFCLQRQARELDYGCWRILARQFLHFAENLRTTAGVTALSLRKCHR